MEAYIKHIAYYLPSDRLLNKDLALLFPEWPAEKIANKVGVEERRIAAANEYSSDLAIKAAELLFEKEKVGRDEIDFLIVCTETPDQLIPHISATIQSKLKLPPTTGALDINLGCSGYVYCLAVAKGLISSGIAKNILLLTADTYSKIIHPSDKGNRTIFGDGASASLISNEGKMQIGEFVFGTDGDGDPQIAWNGGGLKGFKNSQSEDYLFMNGQGVFRFVADIVPALIKDVLDKHQKKLDDVSHFVFHQANKHMLVYLANEMKIELNKLVVDMKEFGNTTSSSIPIALANKNQEFVQGQNLILAGFGVGYSWAGCLLTIN